MGDLLMSGPRKMERLAAAAIATLAALAIVLPAVALAVALGASKRGAVALGQAALMPVPFIFWARPQWPLRLLRRLLHWQR